jgi:hypothetical protein
LLEFYCNLSSAEGPQFILIKCSHCFYGTCDAFHFNGHIQPFFPPSSCCSDNGRHHLVPCIVLFTSIIKSIYIMKLQLTHTHRVACWNTKKGRFVFLCFVRVVMGIQCFWIGKRYCISFCRDLVCGLHRNVGILHLLVCCKHTGDSAS